MSTKDFPPKLLKKLPEGYTDSVESMSTEDLKKEVINVTGFVSDTEKTMEEDQKLQVLKQDLKDYVGGYRNTLGTGNAKIKYCMHVMRLRGLI